MMEPRPLEICIEDLEQAADGERFVRCVALPGGDPGLALDRAGQLRWMPAEPCPVGLWVAGDQQLVLLREAGADAVQVLRGGRSLLAPPDKPVILLDGDELRLGGRRLLVHLHGLTEDVAPPEPIPASALRRAARAAATALSLGAASMAGSASAGGERAMPGAEAAPIEVRARPPRIAPPRKTVYCDVTKMERSKSGSVVHARCPKDAHVSKGMTGQLVASDNSLVKGGAVVVTKVSKTSLQARSELKQPVKGARLRFRVRRY